MKTQLFWVGSFEVESDSLVVSDPCYEKGTWCQGVIKDVVPGKWDTEILTSNFNEWGNRVCELIARAEQDPNNRAAEIWEKCNFEVGVDSGQAGIFDESVYRGPGDGCDDDKAEIFYENCCNVTLTDKRAGVISGGVVSSTGFGDGGYAAYVSKNSEGKVSGVKIVYLEDEDCDNDEECCGR